MQAMIEAEAKKRMERDRELQRKYERIAAKRWKKKVKEVKKQCKRDRMRRKCNRRRMLMDRMMMSRPPMMNPAMMGPPMLGGLGGGLGHHSHHFA